MATMLLNFSIKNNSSNELIKINVEALVASESGDVPKQYDLYMTTEDGNMFGYCGEITTGNPNFTWCSNWLKTDIDTKHDICYK